MKLINWFVTQMMLLQGVAKRWYTTFNGSTSYVDLVTPWVASGDFEVSLYFNDTNITDGDTFISGPSQSEDCIVIDTSSGDIRAFAYVGTTISGIANVSHSSLDSINNIKLSYDSSTNTVTLSVNDSLTDSATWNLDGNQDIRYIASRAASVNFYDGILYNVSLTDLSDSTNSRYYALDEAYGDEIAYDYTGGYNGTYVNRIESDVALGEG